MEAAAKSNLKSVSLELGGKSPLIIFNDADVDMAVDLANTAIFFNKASLQTTSLDSSKFCLQHKIGNCMNLQGEVCVAGSRIHVQEGIYDEFVKKAAESAKKLVVGDPFDPRVNQGPQVVFLFQNRAH